MSRADRGRWRLAALSVLVASAACREGTSARQQAAAPVHVSVVRRIDAPVVLDASGVVEPMQTVAITAQVNGVLQQVAFQEGDYVTAGQVLFRIDQRPLQAVVAQALATLERDEAQVVAAQHDDERYAALAEKGYVSRSQAEQQHATARAQAASVAADRAALRAAELNLAYTTIRAPISGRTGSVLVRAGNVVTTNGTPLVVINQIKPVFVRFPILQRDLRAVQMAIAARTLPVTAMAGDDSTQARESGTVSFLDNAVDSLTGTVNGKAVFQNMASRLWPGQLVLLRVEVSVERNVLAVPTDAVGTGQQGAFVFVVARDQRAQMRPVVPGLVVDSLTVIEHGLQSGEQVVVDGQSRLSNGTRVAIARDTTRGVRPGGDATTARLSPTKPPPG